MATPTYRNFREGTGTGAGGEGKSFVSQHGHNEHYNVYESSVAQIGSDNDFHANLVEGGQLGYGYKAGLFDAATPLAFSPAVIVVLQTPMMWDPRNLGDDGLLAMTTKSMFECHAKSVTGIDVNYNLDSGDQPLGHDGQNFKVPTQSKRAEVNPSFTWPEVTGNLVWNIILRWIWDIQDPDTNAGLEFMEDPLPYTMSAYSLTFMAIQYDQTQHPDRIIDAAIFCNVYPQATGEMGIQRTIGTTEVKERAITFNAYLMHNRYTKYLGRQVAYRLNLRSETYLGASPNVQEIDPMFGDFIEGELDNSFGDGYVDGNTNGIAQDRVNTVTNNRTTVEAWNRKRPYASDPGEQRVNPAAGIEGYEVGSQGAGINDQIQPNF